MKIRNEDMPDPVRRRLLRYGVASLGAIAAGKLLVSCRGGGLPVLPPTLVESAVPGLFVPEGFSARIIARSSHPVVSGRGFLWHAAPDGGACFPAGDGGWIYVSNSEIKDGAGGASAVRFDARGEIVDAYGILQGTSRNCAGGPTPWNTWLSCEEVANGRVWECDPFGQFPARELPALGSFMHEAAAVDPASFQVYLTEDLPDGRFYRFTPAAIVDGGPDLAEGTLEVAETEHADRGQVTWHRVDDPDGASMPTRHQVPQGTPFNGGEGAWHADGVIYFTTKGNGRVWAYDIARAMLRVIYDDDGRAEPALTGVDNVTVAQDGTVYVAEDGGNMQIVAISPAQDATPVVQLVGHRESEVTGPAFDPSGTRLYFRSQRGGSGLSFDGVTDEVTGPFGAHDTFTAPAWLPTTGA